MNVNVNFVRSVTNGKSYGLAAITYCFAVELSDGDSSIRARHYVHKVSGM